MARVWGRQMLSFPRAGTWLGNRHNRRTGRGPSARAESKLLARREVPEARVGAALPGSWEHGEMGLAWGRCGVRPGQPRSGCWELGLGWGWDGGLVGARFFLGAGAVLKDNGRVPEAAGGNDGSGNQEKIKRGTMVRTWPWRARGFPSHMPSTGTGETGRGSGERRGCGKWKGCWETQPRPPAGVPDRVSSRALQRGHSKEQWLHSAARRTRPRLGQ